MRALKPVITEIGLRAILRADNSGLAARITALSVGDAPGYAPDGTETRLRRERRRVPITSAARPAATTINLAGLIDDEAQSYWIREIGVWLEDGTLLAVWSDIDTPLAYTTAGVPILLAFDLAIETLPPDAITVEAGDVDASLFFTAPLARLGSAVLDCMAVQAAQGERMAALTADFGGAMPELLARMTRLEARINDQQAVIDSLTGAVASTAALSITATLQ